MTSFFQNNLEVLNTRVNKKQLMRYYTGSVYSFGLFKLDMSPKLAVADPRVAAFCWKQQITVDLIKVTNNITGTLNNEFNIVILL